MPVRNAESTRWLWRTQNGRSRPPRDAATRAGARGLRLARELGARRMIVYHSPTLARAYRELEDFRSSMQTDSLAADLVREVARSWGAVVHASLALDLVGLGQIEGAQGHIGTARQGPAAPSPPAGPAPGGA